MIFTKSNIRTYINKPNELALAYDESLGILADILNGSTSIALMKSQLKESIPKKVRKLKENRYDN